MSSHKNPNSIKTMFALRFIRALKKMNMDSSPPSAISMADRYKRGRIIRAAAYASMAYSVGPKRAWTRALLRSNRNRPGKKMMKKRRRRRFHKGMESEQERHLRGLVPGGQEMDFERLLNETGHYIKCLKTQVNIMKNILDRVSN